MNETPPLKFIIKFLFPIFGYHQSLFVFDYYRAHLTPSVMQTFRDSNIGPSLIPAETTGLTQPPNIAIN